MTDRNDIFRQYASKGGPLPRRGSGSIASSFWRAYEHGDEQVGLRGGDANSPAGRAFKAGLTRRKVEPGLSPN